MKLFSNLFVQKMIWILKDDIRLYIGGIIDGLNYIKKMPMLTGKKIILGLNRNSILTELYSGNSEEDCKNNKIISVNKIKNIPFFWGRDIEFFYKSNNANKSNWYKWTQENKILKWNGKSYPTGKNVIDASKISTSKELLNQLNT